MTAPILVGQLVRVARPVGGGPVNREGHTGRVLDIADRNRAALIDFDRLPERWVPLANVHPVDEVPLPELRAAFIEGAERAHVAEPEGHADHLDDIEANIERGRE